MPKTTRIDLRFFRANCCLRSWNHWEGHRCM